MDKFWVFLKSHWLSVILCVLAVLFAVIGVPLFINWAFSRPAWCDFFAVDWEAKEALAYYGSALGFIEFRMDINFNFYKNYYLYCAIHKERHKQFWESERMKNVKKKKRSGHYVGYHSGCSYHFHNLEASQWMLKRPTRAFI